MDKFFRKIILASSLVIILFLLLAAWRENLSMDWQKYQQKYKQELFHLAQNDQEKQTAEEYEIKLRQIVLPKLGRSDRCVTCHVAIEDIRMDHMEQPLKSHPGDYLDKHDLNETGCTVCHDGQGRAITVDAAHARDPHEYWEKPLLDKPFIESNCVRCHANTLTQTPNYNYGKALFKKKGCFACHSIRGLGGAKGPDLSDIGDASFHVKMPTAENREGLLNRFNGNVNLAYLHEAIVDPAAQPKETLMQKVDFSDDEVAGLTVYLKSLSSQRRVMDIGVSEVQSSTPLTFPTKSKASEVTGASSKGYAVFNDNCISCHTVGDGDRVGPDLKGIVGRRKMKWLREFIQYPSKLINAKDPIAMDLLKKYDVVMTDMGLTDEDVDEVIKYLKNPEAVTVVSKVKTDTKDQEALTQGVSPEQVSKGIALYQGKQRFVNGGPSCLACHNVKSPDVFSGGLLAKDLTTSFSRLGGMGLGAILKNPPFPVMKKAYKDKPLTEDEVSAVLAFLEKVSLENQKEGGKESSIEFGLILLVIGLSGLFGLFLLYFLFWINKKNKSVNSKVYDRQLKSEDD